ncbi:MAG: hypothetical protein RLY71_443 [Pseudomonadota bacterium]|jgi:lysozyme family protein
MNATPVMDFDTVFSRRLALGHARADQREQLRACWAWNRLDEMPADLRPVLFDLALRLGEFAFVTRLQLALGLPDDGILSPWVLRELARAEPGPLLQRLAGA